MQIASRVREAHLPPAEALLAGAEKKLGRPVIYQCRVRPASFSSS